MNDTPVGNEAPATEAPVPAGTPPAADAPVAETIADAAGMADAPEAETMWQRLDRLFGEERMLDTVGIANGEGSTLDELGEDGFIDEVLQILARGDAPKINGYIAELEQRIETLNEQLDRAESQREAALRRCDSLSKKLKDANTLHGSTDGLKSVVD